MPDFDARPDEYKTLSWAMQPGDAIVFGAEAVHGSAPNDDQRQRRAAISVRYVGDDARWDPRPGTDPIVTEEQVRYRPVSRRPTTRGFRRSGTARGSARLTLCNGRPAGYGRHRSP